MQLWTVCELVGRGDTERRIAYSVVFWLLSVGALPSVKGETTLLSARLVCHTENSSTNPSASFRTPKAQLQTQSANSDALYLREERQV